MMTHHFIAVWVVVAINTSMNYTKFYNSIIANAKSRTIDTYTEKHHIIPRSLGGTDDKCNIVSLTAKEHFVCHLLLTKMYPEGSFEWHKMIKAFMMMQSHSSTHKRYTGKLHENYRVRFSQVQSESQRGEKNSNFGTMWIHSMELEKSKKISKAEAIPEGWQKGRVLDFEIRKRMDDKRVAKDLRVCAKIEQLNALYNEYISGDWKSIRDFCKNSNYDKSHVNLTRQWKQHIPEYANTAKPRIAYKI